ncbi:MAG: prephenate dehydrogenase/arogenate dehydrogenase family protein [Planctomycetota bacterium]
MNQPSGNLDALRQEVIELDKQLLSAAARRNEVVEEIAAAKAASESKQALFDRSREKAVYQRAYETGREVGLPISMTHELMQVLIENSHLIQERQSRLSSNQGLSTDRAQFLIVGGAGRMGSRLRHELEQRGHDVAVSDRNDDETSLLNLVSVADIVILAVPMHLQTQTVELVAPHVRPDALLCDINSLKQEVCEAMKSHGRSETLGLHPMFGPTVHSFRRQKVVVCQLNSGERAKWFCAELERMGMELVHCEPDQHDRMMAVIQVLVHYSTIVMGRALSQSGITIEDSLRMTSPIYRLELSFVSRLFVQNPDLYAQIEMSNPYGDEVRQLFNNATDEWDRIILERDAEAFRHLFNSVADYFHGFSDEAMSLSNQIIDSMVKQP